jgi:hypothetical protein
MKALLSAVLLSVIGVSAFAHDDHQEVVIHLGDNTCKVPDGDKNVVEVHNGLRVVTLNENNVMLTSCQGHDPAFAASDGQTKKFAGFLCVAIHPVMGRLETTQTLVVVSSSGSVHLKCHFKIGS